MYDAAPTTFEATAARADFERALRGHHTARVRSLLPRRRRSAARPRDLSDVAALFWHAPQRRSIPLDAIVGTVDPTSDFDACFRPAARRVAARWQSIARAYRAGRDLPPIAVVERPDGFYVLDGRHRVSVARALGRTHIDALASPSPAGRRPGPRLRAPAPRPAGAAC